MAIFSKQSYIGRQDIGGMIMDIALSPVADNNLLEFITEVKQQNHFCIFNGSFFLYLL